MKSIKHIEFLKNVIGFFKRHRYIAALLALYISTLLFLIWRFTTHIYIPQWDQAYHLSVSYQYYLAMRVLDIKKFLYLFFISEDMYPPLYRIFTAAMYFVVGVRPEAGIFVNAAFLFLYIFSIYKITSLFTNSKVGLFTSFLSILIPGSLYLLQDVLIDFTSMSLFVFSFYLLFKTNYFQNRGYSFLLGIVILLNLLTRWSYIISASVPIAVYVLVSLKRGKRLVCIENLLITGDCALFALSWYITHHQYIQKYYLFFSDYSLFPQQLWRTPKGLEFNNVIYYIRAALQAGGIGLVPLVMFVVAVIILLRRNVDKKCLYLFMSVLSTFIIQALIPDKADKYVVPAYPLMTIIIVYGFHKLKLRGIKILLTGVLSWALITNVFVTYVYSRSRAYDFRVRTLYFSFLPGVTDPLLTVGWPVKQIITDNFSRSDSKTTLLLTTDHFALNRPTMEYYALINNIPIIIVPPVDLYDPTQQPSLFSLYSLYNFNYIFTKTEGDMGVFKSYKITKLINHYLETSHSFIKIKVYQLPDGTQGILYKNAGANKTNR